MQTYQVGSSLVGSSTQSHALSALQHASAFSFPSFVSVDGDPLSAHSVIVFSSFNSKREIQVLADITRLFSESFPFLDIYCDESVVQLSPVRRALLATVPMSANASHFDTAKQVLAQSMGRNVVVVANQNNIELCKQACELEGLNVVGSVALCMKRDDLVALQS